MGMGRRRLMTSFLQLISGAREQSDKSSSEQEEKKSSNREDFLYGGQSPCSSGINGFFCGLHISGRVEERRRLCETNEKDVRDKSSYSQIADANSTCLPSSVDALAVDIMSSFKICRADSSVSRALRTICQMMQTIDQRIKMTSSFEIMRSVADMADRPLLAGGPPPLFQMRVA
jgi:hypothetical protein